jgi:glyoxylase-like metal-dependent hydrolase (beta-lactamase superfamily II)
VRNFFALGDNLDEVGKFDLGGRELEVFGIPGHHPASVAIYDLWPKFQLTGDTVYPGQLYVLDTPPFRAGLGRLVRSACPFKKGIKRTYRRGHGSPVNRAGRTIACRRKNLQDTPRCSTV